MRRPDLLLFAKQPLPGAVKTRLERDYSRAQVGEIAKFLITVTVECAVANWPSDVYLCGAPDCEHALFRALADRFQLRLASQDTGDLGARMLGALRAGIERRGAAAVMGCDVPHCPPEVIERAHEELARGRNVIGPTEDGGYYLIGLQQAAPELFADIAWGGAEVAAVTLARARALGMQFIELPTLRDIDTPESLWLVAQEFEPLRHHLYQVLAAPA